MAPDRAANPVITYLPGLPPKYLATVMGMPTPTSLKPGAPLNRDLLRPGGKR